MCDCGGSSHPALVAPVLGGVDRRDVGHAQPVGERRGGVGDEPVVAVDEVVGVLLRERLAGREHVVVHLLDPGHEAVEVARPAGSRTRWTLTPARSSSRPESTSGRFADRPRG